MRTSKQIHSFHLQYSGVRIEVGCVAEGKVPSEQLVPDVDQHAVHTELAERRPRPDLHTVEYNRLSVIRKTNEHQTIEFT